MSRQNHSDSTNGHPRKSRRRGATQASATHEHPLSQGTPSRPLLGALPLARLIPQDVHSMLDYANGAATTGLAFGTDCPRARAASLALGTSYTAVSLLTDYRLSVAKVIPIETHEALDYAWGAAAIAAPFVLGYWKTAPRVALAHALAGASTILGSLVTDYRAYRGVGRAQR